MARTVLDLDDAALARAAAVLGTTTKVETVNRALRLVAASAADEGQRARFDDFVVRMAEQLAEVDVRGEAWR